jgi:quercetin dioxygenase-like cupin family protein
MTNPPHLSIPARLRPRRAERWPLVLALLAAGLIPHALGHASSAGASASTAKNPCATATRAKPLAPLTDFPATGLPAGPATVHPEYDLLPAAAPWKHSHGGPLYAYVISGHITISDNRGTKTYCAGSFFWEPPGHVHTLTVVRRSELFVLYILPPGATRDITAK